MKKMNVRLLTQLAMFIAMQFVLSKVMSISADNIRIGFGFIPMAVCGALYGPWITMLAYVVADILGGLIIYGNVNPFITVSYAVVGFGYGLFLHRPGAKLFPHAVCAATVSMLCAAFLTTWALSFMYQTSFWAQFGMRTVQVILNYAFELVLIPILLPLARKLKKHGLALEL